MGLSCDCDTDWYPEPGDWYWNIGPDDYSIYTMKRRKHCCSCNKWIANGDMVTKHPRVKVPNTDVECAIYGEDGEIPLAPDWMCEECSDLCFSFIELGYCFSPRDDMHDLVNEYAKYHSDDK